MCDVFLSHAHVNAEVAETLACRLEDEAGIRVWLDKWVLVPCGTWQLQMAMGIEDGKSDAPIGR